MKEKSSLLKWTGIAFTILTSFLFPSLTSHLAFAGLVSFQKEYAYQASEYDSKVSCRALALEQVKRLLLEELGTYLESETEVKNFQLTKDQIVILTAGIVRAEVIGERWDGKTYHLKAKITADPKDVANSIDKLRQDRQKTKELEETRKKTDEAFKEIERLKKELQIAKAEKPNLGPYNEAVKRLSARDWFEKGFALEKAGRNQEAIEAYSMAIELDPKDAVAYSSRADAYRALKNYQRAISDYTLAIGFDPKFALYYSSRADVYEAVGNYQQAKNDLTKAIQLEPNDPWHYFNRGKTNFKLNNHRQAIDDFRRIIHLDIKPSPIYDVGGEYFSQSFYDDDRGQSAKGHK